MTNKILITNLYHVIETQVIIIKFFNKRRYSLSFFFFLNDTPPPEIYTLPLHAALPISFVEDERPTLRDYTPLRYDAARQNLIMDFALHDAGPATEWALTAPLGQWVGLAGPRGSLVISANLPWHWLFGDETAMPAIERRLAERPAGSRPVVRV